MTRGLSPETQAGVRHVRERAGYSEDERFGVLEIRGKDAGAFLDAQLPVRVLDLDTGLGAHTAYLDSKGRVTHDLRLFRLQDSYWILVRRSDLGSLIAKLETYHIREELTVRSLESGLAVWELHGPAAPEILGRLSGFRIPPDPYAHLDLVMGGATVRYMVDPWSGDPGGHLIVGRDAAEPLRAALRGADVTLVDASVLEVLRIEGGVFEQGVDLDERTLLLELGRPEMVSHQKGCYLGQETIARVHSRGHVNRRFLGLELEG
ncbi:MAG TPA: hypothetical protein VFP10_09195, partial [Candidatus Eisenbacteria bacterium]|nr:hypothetical protein [Candidatus Eisenbacteria bacterium]